MEEMESPKRKWRAFYRRLVRESGTPSSIARGWAIGVGVGCVVPIGLQLFAALPLAYWLRASKIGAFGGTLHSNLLTVWLIYPLQCWLGNKLIGGDLTYPALEALLDDYIRYHHLRDLWALGGEVLTSFLIGGAVLGMALVPLTYFGVYWLVRHYRRKGV